MYEMINQESFQFMVCARCWTFNHANFIEDTMNGFTIQETSFPFICLIIDDASTDGEPEVIRQYFNQNFDLGNRSVVRYEETDDYVLTFAQHKANKNCYFAVFYLKYNHYNIKKSKLPYLKSWQNKSKYMASCEGDDFWTDPLKLQKQVDYLESHPECTICFASTRLIDKSGKKQYGRIPKDVSRLKDVVTLEDFCYEQFYVGQWAFHTSTFFYRSELQIICQTSSKNFPYGDLPTILMCLFHGNGYFINEPMSCYRQDSGGFNSSLKENPSKAIRIERKLIEGMKWFDKLTEEKYHKSVERRILRCECLIEYHERGENGWVFLKPKYWPIAKMQGIKNTVLIDRKSVV